MPFPFVLNAALKRSSLTRCAQAADRSVRPT